MTKYNIMKAQKQTYNELTISCQTYQRRKRISLTTYLMIITSLMHLIWQTHAITNSTQTSLEFTFQPSSESGSGFDLIQKEQ